MRKLFLIPLLAFSHLIPNAQILKNQWLLGGELNLRCQKTLTPQRSIRYLRVSGILLQTGSQSAQGLLFLMMLFSVCNMKTTIPTQLVRF